MKLHVIDRIAVLGVLPKEADYLSLMTARDIEKKAEFSTDERAALEFQQEGGRLLWKPENDTGVEMEFSDAEKALLADCLRKLDKDKKLMKDHLGIYRLFMLNG